MNLDVDEHYVTLDDVAMYKDRKTISSWQFYKKCEGNSCSFFSYIFLYTKHFLCVEDRRS